MNRFRLPLALLLTCFVVFTAVFLRSQHRRLTDVQITAAIAQDSLRQVVAERAALEGALDSLAAEVNEMASMIRERESAREIQMEALLTDARRAEHRADSLEAVLRESGLDDDMIQLFDEAVDERDTQIQSLEGVIAVQQARYTELWTYTHTLEESLAAARVLDRNLRNANRLLAVSVEALNDQLHPPLKIRLARGSKIALPAFAAGIVGGLLLTR